MRTQPSARVLRRETKACRRKSTNAEREDAAELAVHVAFLLHGAADSVCERLKNNDDF